MLPSGLQDNKTLLLFLSFQFKGRFTRVHLVLPAEGFIRSSDQIIYKKESKTKLCDNQCNNCSTFTYHLWVSLCFLNEVMEDRRFLMMVSRGPYQVVQVQRMVLGFYRPQKDLSWAEKQAF